MSRCLAAAFVAAGFLSWSCKQSGSGEAAPAPVRRSAAKPLEREKPEKMRQCPLAVKGARTSIENESEQVVFVVTAEADDVVLLIRERAAHMTEFIAAKRAGASDRDQHRAGWMRNCPVVTQGTEVAVSEIPRGARIVVVPTSMGIDELRAEVQRRNDALVRAATEPAGGKH
jgi:hypothetical protein